MSVGSPPCQATVTVGVIVTRTGELYFTVGATFSVGPVSDAPESSSAFSVRQGTVVTTHPGTPANQGELDKAIPGRAVTVTSYTNGRVFSGSRSLNLDFKNIVAFETGYTSQPGSGRDVSYSCAANTFEGAKECFMV